MTSRPHLVSRRRFLAWSGALAAAASTGGAELAFADAPSPAHYDKLLVLIELKGGNDGFNTLVPFADPGYAEARPKLAIARDAVVQLSDRAGLHPALAPLNALWKNNELAVLQGVGYSDPNLSHFRSIEIWDTASKSQEYLQQGWLTRTFAATPTPATFAADGVIVGSNDMGPLAGGGTRALALADPARFMQRAKLVHAAASRGNKALQHVLKTEADIVQAASRLDSEHAFTTLFPATAFGNAIRTACRVVASRASVAAVRVTLGGFDTHAAQAPTQARLLRELAEGVAALRAALGEIDRWNSTLALTYAEFGRRPQENQSAGTDHGTANVHFAMGGRVQGGMYGETASLANLSPNANVAHAIDFRSVYATILERWWTVDSRAVLGGRFAPLPFLVT
ncbi:MAG: DUF1501 domain-containing protein [Betaproteobacteria bacterium]